MWWLPIVLLAILFSLFSASAAVFFGKSVIAINGVNLHSIVALLFNGYFILGALMGVVCRILFVYMIKLLSTTERFANAPTTISNFVMSISYGVIIFATWYFLGEQLTKSQFVGIGIIMTGMFVMGSGLHW